MKLLQELLEFDSHQYPPSDQPAPGPPPGENTPYGQAITKCAMALNLASDLDQLGNNFDDSVSHILNTLGDEFGKTAQEVWHDANVQLKAMQAKGVFNSRPYQKMVSDLTQKTASGGRAEAEKYFVSLGVSTLNQDSQMNLL